MRDWMRGELARRGCELAGDSFTAVTPAGRIPMTNLIACFRGRSGRAVVLSGHYDTKLLPAIRFVGANDGGSSTGFLLEMARVLQGRSLRHDVYLVWFDGEEAIGEWSETDGVYGSRHLAAKWRREGALGRILALINVDMIGDRNLGILKESFSTPSLQQRVWTAAARLGFGRHFLDRGWAVEDDHAPFLRMGVAAVNLIDFEYGPGNSWWHTPEDTMDKLSARSFDVVGRTVLEALRELERQP
jgi:Zn-dependent M28 family amino/carboxypeptidase